MATTKPDSTGVKSPTEIQLEAITAVIQPIKWKPFTPDEVLVRRRFWLFVAGFFVLIALTVGLHFATHKQHRDSDDFNQFMRPQNHMGW